MGLAAKHRQLARYIGCLDEGHLVNSMANFDHSNTVTEGTTLIFGPGSAPLTDRVATLVT